ncbi:transmembrane protein 144 [Lampetra planeri]
MGSTLVSPALMLLLLLLPVPAVLAQSALPGPESNSSCDGACMAENNGTFNQNIAIGFTAAAITSLFYGSNFVPVKKFDTGDGMFFQWAMCTSIWLVGLVSNFIQHCPEFWPLAMLGGFLWATGNIATVPVIKTIGLGLGFLIWTSSNLIVGWASSRFGWFGLDPEVVPNATLNYVGTALSIIRSFILLFVTTEVNNQSTEVRENQNNIVNSTEELVDIGYEESPSDESWTDKLSPLNKKIVGCSLALVAGVFYGANFIPAIYIKNHGKDKSSIYYGSSQFDLDYVFAHFCGIYLTSILYFYVYCAAMKNRPKVYPKAVLPAVASGAMWGTATCGWFLANTHLGAAVSFPIITSIPGIIATLWGVVVFKEIKGMKNLIIVGVALIVTIAGAITTGLSLL